MTEETNATSTVKSGGLPNVLFVAGLFVAGWISFGFGVVGLYEDREFLSLDSVLAVVGLVLVVVSFRVLLKAARTSVEPTSLGGGSFLLALGCIKLAAKTANDKSWWDRGFAVLMIAAGISWIVMMALREKNEATSDLDSSVKKPTNLRFEGETVRGMPDGWSDSHGNVDRVSTLYSFDVESREEGAGEQCVRMHRVNASKEEFGSLMQTIPAHTLAGRAIRIEADIRTEDLDEMAGLWLRIDGDESMLFFDNMEDRPIQGTTPWKTYSQETEVPNKAKWLNYGFLLAGNGTLWAADVRVSASDEQGQYRPV